MPAATTDPIPDREDLNVDQAHIVEAALSANAGLFVQASVPGAGKTYAASRLAAEHAVERAAAGADRPLVGLAVAAFNREAARQLVPEVAAWIRWLVATDETPAAAALDSDDANALVAALRRSRTIGTIDALLQRVFEDVAPEVGFDHEVAVVEDHATTQLHEAALATVRADPDLTDALDRLEAAYPQVKPTEPDRLADILESLFKAARDHRWDADTVEERLLAGRETFYPDGPAQTLADVERDLRRFDDDRATLSPSELHCPPTAVVTADQRLYRAWGDRIADLTRVYRAYVDAYDRVTRETNTVSHTDRTYWVARYFDDPACAHRRAGDTDHALVAARRERLRERWRSRIDLLVIDEAQDVSTGQHDALAPLVTPDTRVVLYGDPHQSINTWRNANPTLFGGAITDGEYFGHDWATHEVETATTTYRQRPALTRTVNDTFGDALTDDRRGVTPTVDAEYDDLDPDRDASDAASLHVATFDPPTDQPRTLEWHCNEGGSGCVDALADSVRGALASGRFGDPDEITPVQVLFRSGTHMDAARETFEGVGLSVGAERPLFEFEFVRAAVAVLSWLVDPTDTARTEHLFRSSPLAPDEDDQKTVRSTLEAVVEDHCWDVVAATTAASVSDGLLASLADLASDRAERRRCSVGELTRRVCRLLDPHCDPLEIAPDATPAVRTRLVDALVGVATSLDGPDVTLASVVAALESMVAAPDEGEALDIESADYDVVFRTVHDAKGDEAPVVALADPGQQAKDTRFHRSTVIARGDTLAVCPPVVDDAALTHSLGGYPSGLFDAEFDYRTETSGLRWTSVRSRRDDPTGTRFTGPPRVAEIAAAKRAEEWRIGYVAATRARDHLVVPVERGVDLDPTRSWAQALGRTLGGETLGLRETTSVDIAGEQTIVSIDDAPGRGPVASYPAWESHTPDGIAQTPTAVVTDGQRLWLPRFLNPSTFRPLARDHEAYVLDHLRHAQLDTDSGDLDPRLPLAFDAVPPGHVGRIAHDAIASVVRKRVWAGDLREGATSVIDSVEWACGRYEREFEPIPDDEREQIVSYIVDTVMPQFADSDVFRRIAHADAVHIEEPIETVTRVDGVDLEVRGQADFVLRTDGEWSIEDLKLAFTDGRPETDDRYHVQLATYRWVLAGQEEVEPVSIDARVTHLGTRAGAVTAVGDSYDAAFVEDLFEELGPEQRRQ